MATLLRVITLLWICFSLSLDGKAQTATELKIDSLRTSLKNSGTTKGAVYHELSALFARLDTDSALHYASLEKDIALQQKDSTLYAQALNDKGVAQLFGGRLDEAVNDFEMASSIHLRHGNTVLAAKSLNNIGAIHEHKGELESAMSAFIRALEAFERGGEREFAAQAKNNVASIHNRLRNFERALEMFRELERYRNSSGADDLELAYVRGNMANSLRALGKPDSAIYYYENAIDILENKGSDLIVLSTTTKTQSTF